MNGKEEESALGGMLWRRNKFLSFCLYEDRACRSDEGIMEWQKERKIEE